MRAGFAKVQRLGDVDDRLASEMKGADRQRDENTVAGRTSSSHLECGE
jgi:hypothetical protein